MTVSMINRTCTHWRKAFLKSATSTVATCSNNVNFTGVVINRISGSVEGDRMLAKSVTERAFSTATSGSPSSNSNGEQAPATPNLTPDKSYNVLTRKKSEVCTV